MRDADRRLLETVRANKPGAPMWLGMTLWAFLRLLASHGFRVSRSKVPTTAMILVASLVNSVAAGLVTILYGWRLRKVTVAPDPVFIIGFQRSGTTYLNELLDKDPRLSSPTMMHCVWPETYLVSRYFLRAVMNLVMAKKRPMDNVAWDPDSPQEDEVAMLMMGGPSPYSAIAFPNDMEGYGEALRRESEDASTRQLWMRRWLGFLRQVQFLSPKSRLLLKSPNHTVRVERILEAFPNAKFIHITRDPYKVFASNVKLNVALPMAFCLQDYDPDMDERRRGIINGFARFHESFENARAALAAGSYHQISYEDLVRDPEATLRDIYQALDLGDFGPLEAPLGAAIAERQSYKTNSFSMEPEDIEKINEAWTPYFEAYGYDKVPPVADAPAAAATA